MKREYFTIIIIFLIISCSPFNTEITKDDVFELQISHDISAIKSFGEIHLEWSEITVEDFKEYQIERKTIFDTSWIKICDIDSSLITRFTDTIFDDEDLYYRVGIVDLEDKIVWAQSEILIPPTTSVIVPKDFISIQTAFDNVLVDEKDTIFVKPGLYKETLFILSKNIVIQSTHGYKATILYPTYHPDEGHNERVLTINAGIFDGFAIKGGIPKREASGGGVAISKDAIVKNCYITDNVAHKGGGVFITENGKLYNNIITGDSSGIATGIFIFDAHGEIINNTIVNNSLNGDDVVISGDCGGLLFRNNIVVDFATDTDIRFLDISNTSPIFVDYSLLDQAINFGENNIVADPQFDNYSNLLPIPVSPVINAGHPDSDFNDTDGTRNDIGAYGGPNSKLLDSDSGATQ